MLPGFLLPCGIGGGSYYCDLLSLVRNRMELSDAFSPLDYFCRRFGGAGGLRYVGDDNGSERTTIKRHDLHQGSHGGVSNC